MSQTSSYQDADTQGNVVGTYGIARNVTDPIESLIGSAEAVQRSFVQALLVDRAALAAYQTENDALMALRTLQLAFQTDVSPILATAR